MTEIQQKLLLMLASFHNICDEKRLRYYIIGGTALGAMRHGGFIPWDDDVDVGMPREDYEELKKYVSKRRFGHYIFEYPGQKKDYVYPFGKMYDTTTTLVENTKYKTRRGIFLDIFPLDGIGDNYEEAITNFRKIDRLVNLLMTCVCAIRKNRRTYKNIAILLMRLIPDFIINESLIIKKIETKSASLSYDKCKYVANLMGNWHEKEIVERKWLGNPKECRFEEITVMCPENCDAYLSSLYGKWRELPPTNKQVSHHDFISIDLSNSYDKGILIIAETIEEKLS